MTTAFPSVRSPRAPSGNPITLPVLLAGVLFLAGCANSYEVKIDSLSRPKAEPAVSYKIQNTNPLVADDSLRYKEAAGLVRTALSGKGLYELEARALNKLCDPFTKCGVVYGILEIV